MIPLNPKKWYFSDWLVFITLFAIVGAHLCTQWIGAQNQNVIQQAEDARALSQQMEFNPLLAFTMNVKKVAKLSTIAAPFFFLSIYLVWWRKTDRMMRDQMAVFFVCFTYFDLANDLIILLGYLLR